MFEKNHQEIFFMGISFSGDMKMKAFYKNQEVVILDKSADLLLIEFLESQEIKWVNENSIRFFDI